jgi:hypothetical protein
MSAEIIPFPRKTQPLKSVRSLDLYYCWDGRLNNPLLNSLFKSEVCYVERWYLQTQHLLNTENTSHPIIQTLFSKEDSTLELLKITTEQDLALQNHFRNELNYHAAQANIVKLNRWQRRWQGLLEYRQRFDTL